MGAPENQNHWIDSGFVVAENNPTVDRQKAEGRKKRQREKMLMVMNRKISMQLKNLKKMKTMKIKLVNVEKPPGDYKTCAVSNLKVVAVVVVVHESPQNPATAGSTPSSPS